MLLTVAPAVSAIDMVRMFKSPLVGVLACIIVSVLVVVVPLDADVLVHPDPP